MRHNIYILLYASLTSVSVYAQDTTGCSILAALLKHDEARQTFKFDKHKDLPIVFIDIKGLFNNCTLAPAYERIVKVNNDTLSINNRTPSNLIIYNLKRNKNIYDLEIQQKYTGAYGHILFKKRRGDWKVTRFAIGYF
jgi:hypothetical protein